MNATGRFKWVGHSWWGYLFCKYWVQATYGTSSKRLPVNHWLVDLETRRTNWDDDGNLGFINMWVYLKYWGEIPQRDMDEGEEKLNGKISSFIDLSSKRTYK